MSAPGGLGNISENIMSLLETGPEPGSGCPGVIQEDGIQGLDGFELRIKELFIP